mmetsp:Transcript_62318/g.129340  ORF Transcript_62318/g.129340 Transcript_62318/m.129340 type:complete len:233 (+) Transcript_62318:361-1059(+)
MMQISSVRATNLVTCIPSRVAHIDPSVKDQFCKVKVLQEQWAETKKRMNWMLEQYSQSGQNKDVTKPGHDHHDFYEISGPRKEGGGYGRADSGVYYAFLMVCKHLVLQQFAEVVLESHTRFSGNVLLPDGTPLTSSFLDASGSVNNTGSSADGSGKSSQKLGSDSSAGTHVSSGWKQWSRHATSFGRSWAPRSGVGRRGGEATVRALVDVLRRGRWRCSIPLRSGTRWGKTL